MAKLYQFWSPRKNGSVLPWHAWMHRFPELHAARRVFTWLRATRRVNGARGVVSDILSIVACELLELFQQDHGQSCGQGSAIKWLTYWMTHDIEQDAHPLTLMPQYGQYHLTNTPFIWALHGMDDNWYSLSNFTRPDMVVGILDGDACHQRSISGNNLVVTLPNFADVYLGIVVESLDQAKHFHLSFPSVALSGGFTGVAHVIASPAGAVGDNGDEKRVFYYHPDMPVIPHAAIAYHEVYLSYQGPDEVWPPWRIVYGAFQDHIRPGVVQSSYIRLCTFE